MPLREEGNSQLLNVVFTWTNDTFDKYKVKWMPHCHWAAHAHK